MMNDTIVGTLYVVATPIGNLEDMVPRAVQILQQVDIIAAEDTRHSAKLLQHFGISTRAVAYHDHSGEQRIQGLLDRLQQGESIALISDAGTPLISDPGYKIVHLARQQNITVVPIPGACALVAALSISGLPSHQFIFDGFLPSKSSARRQQLQAVSQEVRTMIFYESPHRLVESLNDIADVLGADREMVLARELTKTYETVLAGTAGEIIEKVRADSNQSRGEFVLIVKGWEEQGGVPKITAEVEKMMRVLLNELPVKQAASIAAKLCGAKKRELYQWALDNKGAE